MSDNAHAIRTFWEKTETRDWDGLAAVLAADVIYEMEQTRERIRGRLPFVRFFQEYPGDWHLTIRRVIADSGGAVSITDFTVGEEHLTGISFFEFDDHGLIDRIEDVWPEPYEPSADRAHLTERF